MDECRGTSCQHPQEFVDAGTAILKKSGARITGTRQSVLRVLAGAEHPLSPKDILEKITASEDGSRIDQVSVYRILDTFLSLGLVHRVFPEGNFIACSHIGCTSLHHILLRCVGCQKSFEVDVPKETVAPIMWYLNNVESFTPSQHLFQLDGTCKACLTAAEADDGQA